MGHVGVSPLGPSGPRNLRASPGIRASRSVRAAARNAYRRRSSRRAAFARGRSEPPRAGRSKGQPAASSSAAACLHSRHLRAGGAKRRRQPSTNRGSGHRDPTLSTKAVFYPHAPSWLHEARNNATRAKTTTAPLGHRPMPVAVRRTSQPIPAITARARVGTGRSRQADGSRRHSAHQESPGRPEPANVRETKLSAARTEVTRRVRSGP